MSNKFVINCRHIGDGEIVSVKVVREKDVDGFNALHGRRISSCDGSFLKKKPMLDVNFGTFISKQ